MQMHTVCKYVSHVRKKKTPNKKTRYDKKKGRLLTAGRTWVFETFGTERTLNSSCAHLPCIGNDQQGHHQHIRSSQWPIRPPPGSGNACVRAVTTDNRSASQVRVRVYPYPNPTGASCGQRCTCWIKEGRKEERPDRSSESSTIKNISRTGVKTIGESRGCKFVVFLAHV